MRATADGRDTSATKVREAMTSEVVCCVDDDETREAASKMEQHQIRSLIVLNRDKSLVGIVSRGDLAVYTGNERMAGKVTEKPPSPQSRCATEAAATLQHPQ